MMLVLLVAITAGGIWLAAKDRTTGSRSSSGSETQFAGGSGSRTSPDGSPAFVAAFKRLPHDATALQRAADSEFDGIARVLGADELTQVQRIMSRAGGSRDSFTEGELAMLRRHGFGNWVRAQAVRWSHEDSTFETVVSSIWGRSSRTRSESDMTELAIRWGEQDRNSRNQLFRLIKIVEDKSRNLTDDERNKVIAFAGEEYLSGSP
jgi:hypothetical protein